MSVLEQPRIRILTREQAKDRVRAIIREVGGDEQGFREKAEAYLLDSRETMLFDELESLDFLLHG